MQHHEVVIHSPDHHKNFDELPFSQVELILKTYRARHQVNSEKGQVYISQQGTSGGRKPSASAYTVNRGAFWGKT